MLENDESTTIMTHPAIAGRQTASSGSSPSDPQLCTATETELLLSADAVAHDMRSALARMQAHTWLARDSDVEALRRALDAISAEIDCLSRVTLSMLKVSRAAAGFCEDDVSDLDLGGMLRNFRDMYLPLTQSHGVEIDIAGAHSIVCRGHRQLIAQAVSNLVDNALKYGAGSDITLGAEENGSMARLWVADRGPGIAADRREQARRKFCRLREARTYAGTGLGLALVGAVAKLHGGDFLLEDNEPGLRAVILLTRSA